MKNIAEILKPLNDAPLQTYLGTGLHTLGLLGWILRQTGKSDVYVSTFSTSEEFLNGFFNLRKKGLVNHAVMVADLKASKKTVKLNNLLERCFDNTFLAMNHSKIVLVNNGVSTVSVISSQNNTYGGRAESTVISTSEDVYKSLCDGLKNVIKNSVELNGLFSRTTGPDRGIGKTTDSGFGNWRPFGAAE